MPSPSDSIGMVTTIFVQIGLWLWNLKDVMARPAPP